MNDIDFIQTDAKEITATILDSLEAGVKEELYPGDERRIYGDALAYVFSVLFGAVNDACRQRLLRYARGEVLDAIGEMFGVERGSGESASVKLRFYINTAVGFDIPIPAGTRVTSNYTLYFETAKEAVLEAGSLYVDVDASAESAGTAYNGIAAGGLNLLVDQVPYIDRVENVAETAGGSDEEDDDDYRERIRLAPDGWSTAGSLQAYRYHALSASTDIIDVAVGSETEEIVRTLQVYEGHVFQGGANLIPETLSVYLPDGGMASPVADYTAAYEDELLTLTLSGALSDADTVTIRITRNMYGRVKIVPLCSGGEIPDEETLYAVAQACSADNVRPLTDLVEVAAPDVAYYDIVLTYYTDSTNESEVISNVEGPGGAIEQYTAWQGEALGRDINPDYLRKLILCPHWGENLTGAYRVAIMQPEYVEIPATSVAKHSGKVTVEHVVTD